MSTLEKRKLAMPVADLQGESNLPSISAMINVQHRRKAVLDEDDELYLGYGFMQNVFPYRQQNNYNRELVEKEIDIIVLENNYLKASFLPTLGGRLWSLYDKVNNKELLYVNPVLRFGNLALRNAWFSGGVEWNVGAVGHSPFTCSQVFAACLHTKDSTPILRLYEYERIREITYQIDFILPSDSRLLYCRMRVVNPKAETVPVFWWSNIAVPEKQGGRVVVAADAAYTSKSGAVTKIPVPVSDGVDVTYPVNSEYATDYFWKVKPEDRKYICQVDEDGYGLLQTSTSRQKGRKLFVWGQGPGGDHWQEFLSKDAKSGRYIEIQAGLAPTQYECLPMPPRTAWEWMEAYGAIMVDPTKVHGDWQKAKSEVEAEISRMISVEDLEKLLVETKETIALQPAEEILFAGSGWGALENLRRKRCGEKPLSSHLDFGDIGPEQEEWAFLMDNGVMPDMPVDIVPKSWMNQVEVTSLLEKAGTDGDRFNWYTWMHLGIIYLNSNRLDRAEEALNRSMELKSNCWAMYGLAILAKNKRENKKAAMLGMRASLMKPDDASFAKEALSLLCNAQLYREALSLISQLDPDVQVLGRVQFYKAVAKAHTGEIEEAEAILYKDGGLVVPDIREGEISMSELWYFIEEEKAKKRGEVFDRDSVNPPLSLDFRMNIGRKK